MFNWCSTIYLNWVFFCKRHMTIWFWLSFTFVFKGSFIIMLIYVFSTYHLTAHGNFYDEWSQRWRGHPRIGIWFWLSFIFIVQSFFVSFYVTPNHHMQWRTIRPILECYVYICERIIENHMYWRCNRYMKSVSIL